MALFLQLVVIRADLNGHLKALKDYFLLAKGDFFQVKNALYLYNCTCSVEFCIEFVTNLLKSLLGCVSTTRGFYALRVSVLQKRGILCSYPSHSKLKSSLLSKRSSFFFSLHGKRAASSYERVDCTQN